MLLDPVALKPVIGPGPEPVYGSVCIDIVIASLAAGEAEADAAAFNR